MNSTRLFLLCKKRAAASSTVIKHAAQMDQSIHAHYFATTTSGHFAVLLESRNNHSLIHSRGIRHKTGEKTDELHDSPSSSNTKTTSSDPEDNDAIKFREMFDARFHEFYKSFNKPKNREEGRKAIEEFIMKFNKENASEGFKIEVGNVDKSFYKVVLLCLCLASAFVLTLMAIISPNRGVLSEHRAIMKQPPIALDQLILHLGEVHVLTYYPAQNKVVAKLHPGGGGKQFIDLGVNVHLDEAFRCDPQLFPKRLREEENRLGIEPTKATLLAIHADVPYATKLLQTLFFLLIGLPLCWFIVNRYMNWLLMKDIFRVIPTTHPRQPSAR